MITGFLRWDTLSDLDNSDKLFFFQFPIVKNHFQYKERELDTNFVMGLSI